MGEGGPQRTIGEVEIFTGSPSRLRNDRLEFKRVLEKKCVPVNAPERLTSGVDPGRDMTPGSGRGRRWVGAHYQQAACATVLKRASADRLRHARKFEWREYVQGLRVVGRQEIGR